MTATNLSICYPHQTITWATAELNSIARSVKAWMVAHPSAADFDGLFCETLWDEYCWITQNDGYDHDITIGALSLGSVCDAYGLANEFFVTEAIEARPRSATVKLSQYLIELGACSEDAPEDFGPDDIWIPGISSAVIEILADWASLRNLDPIGPGRAHWLQTEVSWCDHIAKVILYSSGEADFIREYADDLLDQSSDLNAATIACVDAYLATVAEYLTDNPMTDFINMFREDLRPALMSHALQSLSKLREEAIAARDACA